MLRHERDIIAAVLAAGRPLPADVIGTLLLPRMGTEPPAVHTVDQLHRLRNRIAHHKPIYRRDLNADSTACLQLIGWMSPVVRVWVADGSRVPRVIAEKH